jgi:protein gp37
MKIEGERYWNFPWQLTGGCSPVSPGCMHCWSAAGAYIRQHQKNPKIVDQYEGLTYLKDGIPTFNGTVRIFPDRLNLAIPKKKRQPRTWAIWNDLLHPKVPFDFVAQAMDVICDERCQQDTFLLVTKRVERWKDFRWWHSEHWSGDQPFSVTLEALAKIPNLWIIPTVCNQEEADRIIPELLQIDEANRGISIEPMLGAIDIRATWRSWAFNEVRQGRDMPTPAEAINAVILGGETGAGARPMHPDWVRSVRDQCAAAGVPFFFKQIGNKKKNWMCDEVRQWGNLDELYEACEDNAIRFFPNRMLDGRTHDDLPWRTS